MRFGDFADQCKAGATRLDRIIRGTRSSFIFWVTIGLDCLLLGLVLLVGFWPTQARFTVEGTTQVLNVHVPEGGRMAGWGDDIAPTEFFIPDNCPTGTLSMPRYIEGPVDLTMRSSVSRGLTLTLHTQSEGGLGVLDCHNGLRDVGGDLVMRWNESETIDLVLPVTGQISLGDDIHNGMSSQKTLLSGTVYTHSIGRFGSANSSSSQVQLFRGDRVFLLDESGAPATAYAILSISDGAVDFTLHSYSSEVQIVHFGQAESAGEVISPGFLDRLQAHSVWGILALIGALFLHMFSAMRDYVSERSRATDN